MALAPRVELVSACTAPTWHRMALGSLAQGVRAGRGVDHQAPVPQRRPAAPGPRGELLRRVQGGVVQLETRVCVG